MSQTTWADRWIGDLVYTPFGWVKIVKLRDGRVRLSGCGEAVNWCIMATDDELRRWAARPAGKRE